MFDSDPITPSYEAKRVLLSKHVDYSQISGGQFCWPFTISSPTASVSSSGESSVTDSSLGHLSSNARSDGRDRRFQLIVTIYRRGWLNRNLGLVIAISCPACSLTLCFGFRMKQRISYVPPPDPSVKSSPPPYSADLPHGP